MAETDRHLGIPLFPYQGADMAAYLLVGRKEDKHDLGIEELGGILFLILKAARKSHTPRRFPGHLWFCAFRFTPPPSAAVYSNPDIPNHPWLNKEANPEPSVATEVQSGRLSWFPNIIPR